MPQKYDFGTLEATPPPAKGSGSYDYGSLAAPAPAEDTSVPARIARTKAGMATQDNLSQNEGFLDSASKGVSNMLSGAGKFLSGQYMTPNEGPGAVNRMIGINNDKRDISKEPVSTPGPRFQTPTVAKGVAALVDPIIPNKVQAPSDEEWKQSQEGAGANIAAMAVGAAAGGAAKVGSAVADAMPRNGGPGFFTRTPANLLKRVMPNVELEHLNRAGSDLKAAEVATKQPITDVPSALAAEEHQAGALNDRVTQILEPQKAVVVPGSRAKFIEEQIKEIPDDIRLHDPERYQKIVSDLQSQSSQPDMTIGDINDARVSANKLRRSFYNSKVGAQLTKDEQLNSALLAGRDRAAHSMLAHGVDTVGFGGATEIKSLSQRLGSLIRVKEGLTAASNPAELESGTPLVSRFGKQIGNLVDKAKGNPEAFDRQLSINDDIKTAMSRWKGATDPKTGKPIYGQEFDRTKGNGAFVRPTPKAGGQGELAPSEGPGMLAGPEAEAKPYQPGMAPMDEVPRRTIWANGAVEPSKGQLDLQKGMAPDLFGVRAPQGPTSSEQPLRFGNAQPIDQTPPPQEGQQSFKFPKTERETWLEEYFKQHPELDVKKRRF